MSTSWSKKGHTFSHAFSIHLDVKSDSFQLFISTNITPELKAFSTFNLISEESPACFPITIAILSKRSIFQKIFILSSKTQMSESKYNTLSTILYNAPKAINLKYAAT